MTSRAQVHTHMRTHTFPHAHACTCTHTPSLKRKGGSKQRWRSGPYSTTWGDTCRFEVCPLNVTLKWALTGEAWIYGRWKRRERGVRRLIRCTKADPLEKRKCDGCCSGDSVQFPLARGTWGRLQGTRVSVRSAKHHPQNLKPTTN